MRRAGTFSTVRSKESDYCQSIVEPKSVLLQDQESTTTVSWYTKSLWLDTGRLLSKQNKRKQSLHCNNTKAVGIWLPFHLQINCQTFEALKGRHAMRKSKPPKEATMGSHLNSVFESLTQACEYRSLQRIPVLHSFK